MSIPAFRHWYGQHPAAEQQNPDRFTYEQIYKQIDDMLARKYDVLTPFRDEERMLLAMLEDLQERYCFHRHVSHTGDPAGGTDRTTICDDCGKTL